MDRIEEFSQAIGLVVGLIDAPELEPRRSRSDWSKVRGRIEEAASSVEHTLLRPLDETLSFASEEQQEQLRHVVASSAGAVAALLAASGDKSGASSLLARAAIVVAGGETRAELQAGTAELDAWCDLSLARWLRRHGHERKAGALFAAVARSASQPALRQAAKDALDAPRPLKSAPWLFTLNGFGVSLYGKRDPAPDGSHVATTFLTALFIPILPLASYRVVPEGDGRFLFLGKVPLSRPMRFFVGAVFALAVAAGGAFGAQRYLESPSRLAGIALDQARAAESSGQLDQALSAYDQLLRDFSGRIDGPSLQPAAEAWVRLRLASVAEPFDRARVDEAERLARRFEEITIEARRGAPAELITERLRTWAGQIPRAEIADLEAATRLFELAVEVCPRAQREQLTAERDALRAKIAQRLEKDWPLMALGHYARLGKSAVGIDGTAAILATFAGESLLAEAREEAGAWMLLAEKDPKHQPLVAEVKAKLERADQILNGQGRKELLESGEKKKLEAELQQWPGDQEVAVALAELRRAEGDLSGAAALLDAFGGPGRLVPSALRLRSTLHLDAERVAEAEELLERLLAHQMPKFQAAQKAYESRVKARQDELFAQADSGQLPADLNTRLNALSEEKAREAFFEWVAKTLESDAQLTRLRRQYERHEEVVPAALSLGMIKLRRSSTAAGETRQKLLADAERAFLSIRQQAEGSPSFHLGLGQVFHRLGKAEEGDSELGALLKGSDFELHLAVANAYRELGLVARAVEVAEGVAAGADATLRATAALRLSVMVTTLEAREKWLALADQSNPAVKIDLALTRGYRFEEEGKLADADREFTKVVDAHAREAAHNSVAANNAAIALLARYRCTRDPAHLERAAKMFEAALRISPDDSIVASNLANTLEQRSLIAVLDKRIQTSQFALSTDEARGLLELLLQEPGGAALAAQLRASPSLRRGLELRRQEQVLAPNRPDGFAAELAWFETLRDEAGLEELATRVARVPSFDTEADQQRKLLWEEGKQDDRARRSLKANLSLLDQVIERLERRPHAPTLAAALILKTGAHLRLAQVDSSAEEAALAVEDCRAAVAAFPESGARQALGATLFQHAVWQVAGESGELRARLEKDGRRLGTSLTAHQAAAASPTVRAALEGHPDVRAAGEAIAASGEAVRLGFSDWIIARLSGQAGVADRAARQLTSGEERASRAIREKIEPLPAVEQALRELLTQMEPETAGR